MSDKMSPEMARRLADHLRKGLEHAAAEAARTRFSETQHEAWAYYGLRGYVGSVVDALESGDPVWVHQPAMRRGDPGVVPDMSKSVTVGEAYGRRETPDAWAAIDELRSRVAATLVRVEQGQSGPRKVGYFATRNPITETVKFYRVTAPQGGKWDGRVFVDVQASDDYHPVKSPTGLATVLRAILADPEEAARLYARELGRCSRCNRTLTDEESRAAGMGPDCRALVGG